MKELGLRLNAKKTVLSPVQVTTYLGMVWNSTTMQAHLSPAHSREQCQARPSTHCETVSKTVGSDGSCIQCDTF